MKTYTILAFDHSKYNNVRSAINARDTSICGLFNSEEFDPECLNSGVVGNFIVAFGAIVSTLEMVGLYGKFSFFICSINNECDPLCAYYNFGPAPSIYWVKV